MEQPLINHHAYLIGHFLLRAGIAFALLFPPIAGISDPMSWAHYLPDIAARLPIDALTLLHIIGAIQAFIAIWIISGRNLRISGSAAALFFIVTVFANLSDFTDLFRDVSLAFAALALALMPRPTARTLP